ncbi:MAG: cysteine--tRNA ligase [Desulfobacterales bacterium]|nr:cysteine--tRNA ligase [Desulfobacterales bacterium]
MALRIYNTLSGQKEEFQPIEEGEVKMYVCGPTVYDSSHIGHARCVIVFDMVYRYLKGLGLDVTYARNFTDIDDKIINRAEQLGVSCNAVAEKYIDEFYRDMDALHVKRPDLEPKATEHIDDILSLIETLIEKGKAYAVDGDVYFRVTSFEGYGKLSGRKLEEMEAGARIDVDERKENPFDFALWKAQKPGEPAWESPWGMGRPGWHIECSAMSSRLLGNTIDIHGGGKDLIFPHHENEIAQSEAAFDAPFVKYWMHNGFVNINAEKMSKSLGNTTMIKDVLKQYHPEAVRLFLLSNHYRSPIDYNEQAMKEAAGNLDKLYTLLKRVADEFGNLSLLRLQSYSKKFGEHFKEFCAGMEDDFNSARGTAALFEALRATNRAIDTIEEGDSFENKITIDTHMVDIFKMANILGVLNENPYEYFDAKKEKSGVDATRVEALIQERTDARKSKNFQRADEIRDELTAMGVAIEDGAGGTTWKMME